VSLDELLEHRHPFLLVCDGVTDPPQLGRYVAQRRRRGRDRRRRAAPSLGAHLTVSDETAAGAIEYLTFCDVGGVPAALDVLNRPVC